MSSSGNSYMAGWLVPVEVRDAVQYGEGRRGIFATGPVASGTDMLNTEHFSKVHCSKVKELLEAMPSSTASEYLRQSFVLPDDLNHLCVFPHGAGGIMNHSANANLGFGKALRDIHPGEEVLTDYSFFANPTWYEEVCVKYGVPTKHEIAKQLSDRSTTPQAFLVPVEVRDVPQYGKDHKGVFATAFVAKGTQVWEWTDLVSKVPCDAVERILESMSPCDSATYLRQAFVLPDDLEHLCVNPEDAGRFVNHSPDPNIGFTGALRDIEPGEEIVMDYGFHGNPVWYQRLCAKYKVLTESQVACNFSAVQGGA
eukprot:TRINITY_DN52208_c0_g1_i1.p1 TRINITY_DN52208_c0_g1~~TRINITY_DN52208_c0_g1_i1.p1  ORF type:complete len:324 (+),score=52.92 TRINITY_DN52208_c0_g1_i1:40-972(+)